MINEDIIAYYFSLNKRITRIKWRLRELQIDFYQQTMCSYCTSDENKLYSKGFPVESKVIELVDSEEQAKSRMAVMKFKQRHFLAYLKQISSADRYFLTHKYKWQEGGSNDRVERECFEEIQEIEEAARHRFKLVDDNRGSKLEKVCAAPTTGEQFTAHFEDMLKLLEV
ncbi:hypothetical protein [Trichococcus pasteurii]|uniref:Uncharacterized protein n=1 Tax=Trichococcus pasteurii TaxID=43064 RepID=A0A1W1ID86_9LACT|nr:hypothetical protein [Trichococcus pasteurii]SFE36960.1 hypothetical protein SAMN04488086_10338 [Trichococcus pasteurii]SLM50871.1 Hypothetical protein TPAS_543 [Trichococcus pasteurii]SSB91752.1 Hypothetical protein TPAS_543 [Trichococcus pasteurii]